MPLTVYLLGMSIFALGTSEFMLAGLLPALSADLGVSIPDAGLLISAYALGMLVGAPLLAVATMRLPRKTTLLGTLGVFVVAHVAGALAPTYAALFASRVVGAVACAGFWAVAAATAVAVVPGDRRGRAMAIVAGGLTVATVFGVPAGTFLGQHAGWRSAFWAVAALSAVAFGAVWRFVPATAVGTPARVGQELRAYREPRLWLALAITALTTAATTATFSYLAPLLTDEAALSAGWVPAVLTLYGIGAFLGISAGGRVADRRPLGTLVAGNGLVAVILVVVAASPTAPVTVVAAFLLGFAGFFTNPALNTRVFALAGSAPTLAGASNVTAFNTGILVAPWLAGQAIDAGFGYRSVTWVSIALAALALAAVAGAAAWSSRDTTRARSARAAVVGQEA